MGIAGGLPPGDRFGTALFGRADAALYQAKRGGRNCVVVDCTGDTADTGTPPGASSSAQDTQPASNSNKLN